MSTDYAPTMMTYDEFMDRFVNLGGMEHVQQPMTEMSVFDEPEGIPVSVYTNCRTSNPELKQLIETANSEYFPVDE